MGRVLISIKIDERVLEALKERAANGEGNGRYQTLINEILEEAALARSERPRMVPLVELEKLVEKWK